MSNTAMQNRQPEKIPKAMLRLMFALVVFVLLAVSVARVSVDCLLLAHLPSQKLWPKLLYTSLAREVVL